MGQRIRLGSSELFRNPTTISTNNTMPKYEMFQPLDGTVVPVEKKDRVEITLHWDRVSGLDLQQLINIIKSSQVDGGRTIPTFYYNDYHLMDGYVVIISASIIPVGATGGKLNYPWLDTIDWEIPLDAAVTIVLAPYVYWVYSGV